MTLNGVSCDNDEVLETNPSNFNSPSVPYADLRVHVCVSLKGYCYDGKCATHDRQCDEYWTGGT